MTQVSLANPEIERWRSLQANDPELAIIYNALTTTNEKPSAQEMSGRSWEAKCVWSLWDQLTVVNEVIYLRHGPSYMDRLVVPEYATTMVRSEINTELGHVGVNKMEDTMRRRFWWPHLRRDLSVFCKTCRVCGSFKGTRQIHRAPLVQLVTGYPNELVAMDIIGPLNVTSQGNRYILVLVDHFTKWCEASPLRQADAQSVADCILREWVCKWGAPEQLHSDRGSNFESATMRELCLTLGIEKTRTTPYHPAGNGIVERVNRSLKALLKAFVGNSTEWDKCLPQCLLSYQSTVHASKGKYDATYG